MKKWACLFLVLLLIPVVYASTVTRSFSPKKAMQGDTVTVTLTLDEGAQELSYIIEESVPEGWQVSANGGGEVSGSKISWLLIEGLAPGVTVEDKIFTYTLVVPSSASGAAVFNGTYRFESMSDSSSVLGETMLNVGSAAPASSAPAPIPYIPPPSAPVPVSSPVAYVAPSPLPSAYDAPEPAYEPTPVYDTYAPPAPAEAYVPPVSETVPAAPAEPAYEPAAYEAASSESAPTPDIKPPTPYVPPSTTDYQVPDSPIPTSDYQPSATDSSPPVSQTPWLWIVAGIVAVAGIIGGGFYLKQRLKETVPAGGQQFSPQSVTYYIKQYSSLGYSKEQVISHLVKNGIPLDMVKQAISEYEKNQVKAG